MIEFITETSLSKKVAYLVNGCDDVRIAVAFWGDGGSEQLNLDGARKGRILCNVRSGACNPDEIKSLMGRKSFEVRTLDRLHAKVYWTPTGIVIGSSNASTNGLAIEAASAKGWFEANLFTDNPAVLDQAREWFEKHWKKSVRINSEMLAEAREKWKRRARESSLISVRENTLLAAARSDPKSFKDQNVFLALYDDRLSQEARDTLKQLQHSGTVQRMDDGTTVSFEGAGLYENWDIPAGAWLIDCSLSNPQSPRVWGIYRVPSPTVRVTLPETTAIIAFKQPGVKIPGRLLKLPAAERQLIEHHMKALFDATPRNQLLHISDAAGILNKREARASYDPK